jgi:signal transduction histidine kinase
MAVSDALVREGVNTLEAEVAIVDSEGTIVYTNAAWQAFAVQGGFPGDPAMVGSDYFEAVEKSREEDEYAAAASDGLREVADEGRERFTLEYPCPGPDDRFRWFLMWVTGFTHGDDEYLIIEHVDITDRRRAEQRISARNRQLRALASILSHDLRNPLNVASGYGEILAEETDDDRADRILRSLDRMDSIIDDALTLARRTTVENVETVDLAECVRTAWEGVPTADATLEVESSRPVECDGSLLRTIFENLFRNCVEHGGEGVTVRVGALDDGFFVADDGPGMPPELRGKAFDPGVTSMSRQTNTGLGLTIVRNVADAHDWTVELTESESGGARFEFHDVAGD